MCPRCADLEEQVAWYKSELGLRFDSEKVLRLRVGFGLTKSQSRLLMRLHDARGAAVSREQAVAAMTGRDEQEKSENLTSAVISNIRRRLGFSSIETLYGDGYRLTPKGRELVDRVLATPVEIAA